MDLMVSYGDLASQYGTWGTRDMGDDMGDVATIPLFYLVTGALAGLQKHRIPLFCGNILLSNGVRSNETE